MRIISLTEYDFSFLDGALLQKFGTCGCRVAFPWKKLRMSLHQFGNSLFFAALYDQAKLGVETLRKSFRAFLRAMLPCYGQEFFEPSSICDGSTSYLARLLVAAVLRLYWLS